MSADQLFSNKAWLIYGRLGMAKNEVKEAITSRGGRVVSSISKKLNVLVWNGDTLVPGDAVSSVKPKKMLAQGGLVVGEEDFLALLNGTVADKIASYLDGQSAEPAPAKASAPKKKPAAKKSVSSGSGPLELAELLERCRGALAAVGNVAAYRAVERVLHTAITSGQSTLAASIAETLPEQFAPYASLYVAQRTGQPDLEEKSAERIASAYRALDTWQKDQQLPELVRAAYGGGASAGVKALRKLVSAAVTRATKDSNDFTLRSVLEAWVAVGAHKEVRSLLKRLRAKDPQLVSRLDLREAMQAYVSKPDELLEALEAFAPGRRYEVFDDLDALDVIGWSEAQIVRAAELSHERFRVRLAQALIEAKRDTLARKVFARVAAKGPSETLVRHLVLGETDAARSAYAPGEGFEPRCIDAGIETLADVSARFDAAPTESLTADIQRFLRLGEYALAAGLAVELEQVLARLHGLLASTDRRPANEWRTEAETIGEVLGLQVRHCILSGDDAAARKALEEQLKGIKSLQTLAASSTSDGSMRTPKKNDVVKAFIHRAGQAGHADLALKASKKLSKKERQGAGGAVGRWFLPGDPRAALEASEAVAGTLVVDPLRPQEGSFFARLWAAVLSTSAS